MKVFLMTSHMILVMVKELEKVVTITIRKLLEIMRLIMEHQLAHGKVISTMIQVMEEEEEEDTTEDADPSKVD